MLLKVLATLKGWSSFVMALLLESVMQTENLKIVWLQVGLQESQLRVRL